MTDYDRGGFVRDHTITIEPCANGTFLIRRTPVAFEPQNTDQAMGFSSAADMLKFLQSEYSVDPRGQAEAPPMENFKTANPDAVLRAVDQRHETGVSLDEVATAAGMRLIDLVDMLLHRTIP